MLDQAEFIATIVRSQHRQMVDLPEWLFTAAVHRVAAVATCRWCKSYGRNSPVATIAIWWICRNGYLPQPSIAWPRWLPDVGVSLMEETPQ